MKGKIKILFIALFGLILFNSCDYIKKEQAVGIYLIEDYSHQFPGEILLCLERNSRAFGLATIEFGGKHEAAELVGTWEISKYADLEIHLSVKDVGEITTAYVKDGLMYGSLEDVLKNENPTIFHKMNRTEYKIYESILKERFNVE